jgi:PKD repeat protein
MSRTLFLSIIALLLACGLAACNLSGGDASVEVTLTADSALTALPSRTPQTTSDAPTPLPLGTLLATQQTLAPRPTNVPFVPTAIVIIPTFVPPVIAPTNTPAPISILILSPVPGNVVAGNVQILGAAVHPQFLQYQLEYGPEGAPNLWYQATSAQQVPINNGILGVWNTTSVPDGAYNLRLRVYLRDGTTVATVVNNIRVQNRTATPIPSATPNIPRPIAAFTQNVASGQVPLTVRFVNQSSGEINSLTWNFGDGSSSNERDPVKTFNTAGLFNVTLTVAGPGGTSNVSRQISVQNQNAPVSAFSANPIVGNAPLTVQFSDQSSGAITSRLWNFSDGGASNEQNPVHVFAAPGVYNVFLTVTGAGGSSTSTRQITVQGAPTLPPPATLTLPPTATRGIPVPSTVTPLPTATLIAILPSATVTPLPTLTETPLPTATTIPPTNTDLPTLTLTLLPTNTDLPTLTPTDIPTNTPIPAPVAAFDFRPQDGNPLGIAFFNQSTGDISGVIWDFGDGTQSSEANPVHIYSAPNTYTVTLSVSGAGGTNFIQRQVTIQQPLIAAFSVQPAGAQTFQFTNQSSGAVSYLWDFNDGTQSADTNPSHTYAAPGTYTVTLFASAANGSQTSTQQQVVVSVPLSVDFSAQTVEGDPLTYQFNANPSAPVVTYAWDFGDGTTSADSAPQHIYPNFGGYTVTLTVTGQDGSTASASQTLSIEPEQVPPTPETITLQDTTPILPNISALTSDLRPIYDAGIARGNNPRSFARVGDESLTRDGFLTPFSDPSGYSLEDNADLQAIIDFYGGALADGSTPFGRIPVGAANGWRAADLLDFSLSDPTRCDLASGETPFGCELRLTGASVVLISVGAADVANFTDPTQFQLNLQALIDSARNFGAIPVLYTIQPGGDDAQTRALNDVIIRTAEENRIPLINAWRAVNGLSDVAPDGAGDLSGDAVNNFALNALNAATLRTLNDIRNGVFPDA